MVEVIGWREIGSGSTLMRVKTTTLMGGTTNYSTEMVSKRSSQMAISIRKDPSLLLCKLRSISNFPDNHSLPSAKIQWSPIDDALASLFYKLAEFDFDRNIKQEFFRQACFLSFF